MKNTTFCSFLILFVLISIQCQSTKPVSEPTQILWDEWGVPHIFADNDEELFYSYGWAQMTAHADLMLKLYGQARGQAAEYWGAGYLESDMQVQTMRLPELSEAIYQEQNPEFKGLLDAFTRGVNDYAARHAELIADEMEAVLPIRPQDVLAHGQRVICLMFVGGNEFQLAGRPLSKGSNAYAIAPSRTASGNAMLVTNPHLPWNDFFLFHEAHWVTPEHNIYGTTLVGMPQPAIAFNEHLGWTHTVNTIDAADVYVLKLQEEGYLFDGKVESFETQKKMLKIKQEDGSLKEQEITIRRSKHGPVIRQQGKLATAIRIAGLENAHMTEQWWEMSKATNLEEFESALQKMQMPMFNAVYADKDGNILYFFGGNIPKRAEGDWSFWQRPVPGDDSKYLWTKTHSYEELPKVLNPPSGWVQNANDPPWTSTFPMELNPDDFPPYMAPQFMHYRAQRSVRMLDEDDSITFDELVSYKLSSRMELADRILDDLNVAANGVNTNELEEAMKVLNNWDREADNDSKGAVLFAFWVQQMGHNFFGESWNTDRPRQTPDGLADPEKAIQTLIATAANVKKTYGRLDVPWGEVFRLRYGGKDLPANGGDGGLGIFRVLGFTPDDDGKFRAYHGDTYVAVVEFGENVKAKVLLSYGNATQPHSPHLGDQLELFSKKQFRNALLNRETIAPHLEGTETLIDGSFVK